MLVGILPTLGAQHLDERALSAPIPATPCSTSRSSPPAARTSRSHIDGIERLSAYADSIAPEAACTSMQLHQLVHPDDFPPTGTPPRRSPASSSRSAPTRPSSSARSCGGRPASPSSSRRRTRGRRSSRPRACGPRVWFGERWITSIFDLFEENVRYFPALLPLCEDEDPEAVLNRGDTPRARRAQAPQRHDLPLEPAGLRGRARPPARARRESRAAVGADGGRHARQRRLLLRPGARR